MNQEITNLQELVVLIIRAYAFGEFYNAEAAIDRATQHLAEKNGDEQDSLDYLLEHFCEEAEESSSAEDDTEEDESSNGSIESEKTDKENKEVDEEEICTDLKLAWKVLKLAKLIFTNLGDFGKKQITQTLMLLGMVAFRQLKLAEPYKLGIVHSTVSNIDEAVEFFKNSIEILKKKIKFLEERKKEKTYEKTHKKINNKNVEIEKMKILILKIRDMIVEEKRVVEMLQEMEGSARSAKNKEKTPTKQDAASSSTPNDNSNLVKRQRKIDDDSGEGGGKPSIKPTP